MPKSKGIPQIPIADMAAKDGKIYFSFKHLDNTNQKFNVTKCNADFFHALMEELRKYNHYTVEEFQDQNNEDNRHTIDFPHTTEEGGFPNIDEDQLGYCEAWQFGLSQYHLWRVHGILCNDIFYIIWLDSEHLLCVMGGGKPKV